MNWELFYLTCFVVGFAFCAISFLSGALHFSVHIPKHVHFGSAHAASPPTGAGHSTAKAGADHGESGGHFSVFNPMTLAAFLTWFGGAGYLLEHYRHIWIFAGLAIAGLSGMAGAGIVFWFVAKVLMANERDLDPADYEMVGTLGNVSSAIRAGGTGEIIFVQEGVRKPCAARCELSESLAKGEEVLVTRYERGIAYVRRWADLANQEEISSRQQAGS